MTCPVVGAGQVTASVNGALVADFSQWYVETDDLMEFDVVDVNVNLPVSVIFDALPDVELTVE